MPKPASSILFREVSRPPGLLILPLVSLGAVVIALAAVGQLELDEIQGSVFVFCFVLAALGTTFLLDFLAQVIEVTGTEIRSSFARFYRRRIMIADIHQWRIRNDLGPPGKFSIHYRPELPTHYVDLAMKNGSIFTIVSAHPERLSNAINSAKATVTGK